MGEELTLQQREAVFNRGGNLLVSAAAGSGKTKVLVDRLLSYILDPVRPANIDDFLIITYTKAAAAELRGKISAKISEKIALDPNNRHLQKQMQRLYLAKISTVHSFCADILREHAYRLDLSADFRVADENECVEIQANVLQKVIDIAYETAYDDPDFYAFIDSQGFGRDDRQIPEIILKVYHSAACHLNPDAWLKWCLSNCVDDSVTDAAETVWGRYLIEDLRSYLNLHIDALKKCIARAEFASGMEKTADLLNQTVDQLVNLKNSRTWDDVISNMHIDYGRLTFSKQCTDLVLIDQIKTVREACKKGLSSKLRRFTGCSEQVLRDMRLSLGATRGLLNLVRQFIAEYQKAKKVRRILDFGDLEQRTLDLLIGKSRGEPTLVAREISLRFREVLVDEYQDSNEVQDAIFEALTAKEHNCFMVGDVKQSIYQFRLADPGIFLEKYNTFASSDDAQIGQGRKVLLSSNFRSSAGVIKAVNDVFSNCMSKKVGGLLYSDEELLREGIPHIELPEAEVELCGIDVQEDTYQEEAAFVAEKISSLLDGKHMVRDGENLRPVTQNDIVILLRSPGSVGGEFQYALEQRGIRCLSGTNTDLLQTEEVQTLISILQVLHNPLQDIYLVAAMMSRVFGFTADELASLRSRQKHGTFYSAVCEDSSEKVKVFLEQLAKLRRGAQTNTLTGILNQLFALTRIDSIYASLPDGAARNENLQALCQIAAGCETMGMSTLGRFLEHISAMEERGITVAGEDSAGGAVTIMSIHKSKGLEFPVVFLCGLSRDFNKESVRAQVLCDKTLGLGLTCTDSKIRVRYPSLAKHAIAAKMNAEGLSEEMRVLYVAMTRARDRLIMTYAARKVDEELRYYESRSPLSDNELMALDAQCPGDWVLLTCALCREDGWTMQIVRAPETVSAEVTEEDTLTDVLPKHYIGRIRDSLQYKYPHLVAVSVPSKRTATQLKGREKDVEAAENTRTQTLKDRVWRRPSFIEKPDSGAAYGSLLHRVMQYLHFDRCCDKKGIRTEIECLTESGYISEDEAQMIPIDRIEAFFHSEIGKELLSAKHILREFKFSVLADASKYGDDVPNEQILLQGVVDCALIQDDGIVVLDFKSDRVTDETLGSAVNKYALQIRAYANALSEIYCLPIKKAMLYFFALNRFVEIE